ncbi:MAG: exodeoxyribonuclease VII small subunit [Victivallaceae bacterium]|nr:exodeoxyribonuclease VII small subunit [Victivallaceae bacterium]
MAKNDNSREPAFEEALAKLESLVEKMEEGDLPLDKMIDCFERGTALANLCDRKLKALEKKIQVLVNENEDGGEWSDFDKSSERSDATIGTPEKTETETATEVESDLLF